MPQVLLTLRRQLESRLPFAIYRMPGAQTVYAVLQNTDAVNPVLDWDVSGFVFAPYRSQDHPFICITPDQFLEFEYTAQGSIPGPPVLAADQDQHETHLQRVRNAVRAIQDSPLEKVVLARSISTSFDGDPLQPFLHMLEAYPGAFCYVFYHPVAGLWTGATPELLLSHRQTTAQTMALAGTLPAEADNPPQWSPKEIWEQQVVTDFICSRLKEQGLHPEVQSATSVRAGALWHLKTPISVQVSGLRRDALIRALHPTPAVCGFPLKEAQHYIDKYEGLDRAYYTGYLGPLNLQDPADLTLFVNLRCARLRDGKATVYVGGGITGASDPELEWEETRHKAGTMLSVLNKSVKK